MRNKLFSHTSYVPVAYKGITLLAITNDNNFLVSLSEQELQCRNRWDSISSAPPAAHRTPSDRQVVYGWTRPLLINLGEGRGKGRKKGRKGGRKREREDPIGRKDNKEQLLISLWLWPCFLCYSPCRFFFCLMFIFGSIQHFIHWMLCFTITSVEDASTLLGTSTIPSFLVTYGMKSTILFLHAITPSSIPN